MWSNIFVGLCKRVNPFNYFPFRLHELTADEFVLFAASGSVLTVVRHVSFPMSRGKTTSADVDLGRREIAGDRRANDDLFGAEVSQPSARLTVRKNSFVRIRPADLYRSTPTPTTKSVIVPEKDANDDRISFDE